MENSRNAEPIKDEKEINTDILIADVYDAKSNSIVIKDACGRYLSDMIFFVFCNIYQRYSMHKEVYPSFDHFSIVTKDQDEVLIGNKLHKILTDEVITFIFTETDTSSKDTKEIYNKFYIKFKNYPDRLEKYWLNKFDGTLCAGSTVIVIDDEIISDITIMDNKTTRCNMANLIIPYQFVYDAYRFVDISGEFYNRYKNMEDYKDSHDTILSYNIAMSSSKTAYAKCKDGDTYNAYTGLNIAYNKLIDTFKDTIVSKL